MVLSEQIKSNRNLGVSICRRLNEEIDKLGFAIAEIKHYPNYDHASFELIKDPYTGAHNLTCYWYDEFKKQRIGRLQFNSDGTFYAEYDVIKTHPGKSKWFVEGVIAWGKAENIKAEAKLLSMPTG
ncbi:conserved hypothetical protein [Candidatus Methylobacter favarea]|uniref:Uncharacterized protein n=1 Tax=Candidatus Methylobacter favarea TaxID=2707345 RepID=A0A8S0XHW9_9GAMM|nr:hypothetical protein [Candidatus Methylobacter favarea]CAA9890103.1 conserved hypothetical protein [Candidatus Methylobacter favarea]